MNQKGIIKIQSPQNTTAQSPKNFKPNQAKSVRECERKKGWASFKNFYEMIYNRYI